MASSGRRGARAGGSQEDGRAFLRPGAGAEDEKAAARRDRLALARKPRSADAARRKRSSNAKEALPPGEVPWELVALAGQSWQAQNERLGDVYAMMRKGYRDLRVELPGIDAAAATRRCRDGHAPSASAFGRVGAATGKASTKQLSAQMSANMASVGGATRASYSGSLAEENRKHMRLGDMDYFVSTTKGGHKPWWYSRTGPRTKLMDDGNVYYEAEVNALLENYYAQQRLHEPATPPPAEPAPANEPKGMEGAEQSRGRMSPLMRRFNLQDKSMPWHAGMGTQKNLSAYHSAWVGRMSEKQREEWEASRLAAARERINHVKKKHIWNAYIEWMDIKRAENLEKLKAAGKRWLHKSLSSALHSWLDAVELIKQGRKALNFMRNLAVSKALRTWNENAMECRTIKRKRMKQWIFWFKQLVAARDRARGYVAQRVFGYSAKAFKQWYIVLAKAKAKRARVRKFDEHSLMHAEILEKDYLQGVEEARKRNPDVPDAAAITASGQLSARSNDTDELLALEVAGAGAGGEDEEEGAEAKRPMAPTPEGEEGIASVATVYYSSFAVRCPLCGIGVEPSSLCVTCDAITFHSHCFPSTPQCELVSRVVMHLLAPVDSRAALKATRIEGLISNKSTVKGYRTDMITEERLYIVVETTGRSPGGWTPVEAGRKCIEGGDNGVSAVTAELLRLSSHNAAHFLSSMPPAGAANALYDIVSKSEGDSSSQTAHCEDPREFARQMIAAIPTRRMGSMIMALVGASHKTNRVLQAMSVLSAENALRHLELSSLLLLMGKLPCVELVRRFPVASGAVILECPQKFYTEVLRSVSIYTIVDMQLPMKDLLKALTNDPKTLGMLLEEIMERTIDNAPPALHTAPTEAEAPAPAPAPEEESSGNPLVSPREPSGAGVAATLANANAPASKEPALTPVPEGASAAVTSSRPDTAEKSETTTGGRPATARKARDLRFDWMLENEYAAEFHHSRNEIEMTQDELRSQKEEMGLLLHIAVRFCISLGREQHADKSTLLAELTASVDKSSRAFTARRRVRMRKLLCAHARKQLMHALKELGSEKVFEAATSVGGVVGEELRVLARALESNKPKLQRTSSKIAQAKEDAKNAAEAEETVAANAPAPAEEPSAA